MRVELRVQHVKETIEYLGVAVPALEAQLEELLTEGVRLDGMEVLMVEPVRAGESISCPLATKLLINCVARDRSGRCSTVVVRDGACGRACCSESIGNASATQGHQR